jgi:hypothetical protein
VGALGVAVIGLLAVLGVAGWIGAADGAGAAARARAAGLPRQQVAMRSSGATTGQAGGLIRMTEDGLEMVMTPLSGQAPTWAEVQHVYQIVSRAAAATAKYKDLAIARRDGYVTAPDLLVERQGTHYYNQQYLDEASRGIFDPAHPPFLVYNTVHGRPTLSGLMFYIDRPGRGSPTPRQLAQIFPASMASWHQHVNVCVGGGTSLLDGTAILHYYDPQSCAAHGGHFVGNTGWMVHTWIGQANGTSLFAMDMNKGQGSSSGMSDMPGMAMPTPAPTRSSHGR